MSYNKSLINTTNILSAGGDNFEELALQLFRYQYEHNSIYRQYCDALRTDVAAVKLLSQVPFLPISFFKSHIVFSGTATEAEHITTDAALTFESSGTTGENTSRHYVKDAGIYEASLLAGFRQFYGAPGDHVILALLPSYLERRNASLVHMARVLMEQGGQKENGFYINEWEQLHATIAALEAAGRKSILLGVTFALLDFADNYPMQLRHTVVMETGGMKGRREELTRKEVHDTFRRQWQVRTVHSEYGMTELLSQAYALQDGIFSPTATMRVLVRDINDPLDVAAAGTGALNIVDLANVHSCSFIATEDIGTVYADGTFEVLGRMDNSILRGCSLMAV